MNDLLIITITSAFGIGLISGLVIGKLASNVRHRKRTFEIHKKLDDIG